MSDLDRTLDGTTLPAVLVAGLPDASVIVVDDDLRILMAEGGLLRRMGWPSERLVGRLLADIMPSDVYERISPVWEAALAGDVANLDGVALRTGLPYRLTVVPLSDRDDGVPGAMAVVRERVGGDTAADPVLEAEARFDLVFDRSPIGMALVKPNGMPVRVNAALCDLLGYRPDEILATHFHALTHPDDIHAAERDATRLLSGEADDARSDCRLMHARGGIVHAEVSLTLIRDLGGRPRQFVVQVSDVSERREMEFRLEELAERDPLTGLPNRPLFEQELARQVALCRRVREPAALLLLDLDHFKFVNDAHGHRVGDELLRRVAVTVRRATPSGTVIARLGGDELAVLLPGVTAAAAREAADKLRSAIRDQELPVGSDMLHTTASVGVAPMDGEVSDPETVLVSADLAMYEAKASGGDRTMVHDPDGGGRERASSDLRWSQRIRSALDEDAFEMHAQPIVEAVSRRPVEYELLLRMRDADGGLIAPGDFLPHAERFGLIGAIDRWVAQQAVALVARHDVRLSLNLSGRSVGDPTLPGFIEGLVTRAGIDPQKLTFEVTETAAIANMGHAQHLARRLRSLGCGFALDDFGAGFASFTYVKQIPFDVLKIDGSFVRDLATSASDRLVVRALVEVARGLGKQTVAEYVHDGAVLEEVRRCGVDFAQGFHVGAPAPLEAWL